MLDDVPGSDSVRTLPIHIESEVDKEPRRELRWRDARIVPSLARPIPPPQDPFAGEVTVAAFHSFKGGVGRTLHAVALAEAIADRGERVLLVDGDLEAPGLTWMFAGSGKRIDFAYEDFLALAHSSTDGSPTEAVRLGAAYLPNQTLGNVVLLPARRHLDSIAPPRIQPQDLATANRSRYFLTESLVALAVAVGARAVLIDLRAGNSELAASVLLDPRVQRIFVSTVSAQSLDGTELTIRELARRAPSRLSDPPTALILTQYRPTESAERLADLTAPLIDAVAASLAVDEEGITENVDRSLALEPILSVFQDGLLGLPADWDSVVDLVRNHRLPGLFAAFAEDLAPSSGSSGAPDPSQNDQEVKNRRASLSGFAESLAYAETANTQSFLATDSLRSLVLSHRTEAPLCVVTGAKGAGKTFTQLQMSYRRTWKAYAAEVGVNDVDLEVSLVPVLTSRHVSAEIEEEIALIRQESADEIGESPISLLDIRSAVQDGIRNDLGEREWRQLWIWCLARSLGIVTSVNDAEASLAAHGSAARRVFLIDGLEDILQDVATDAGQQRALRVLLIDCLEWLRSLRGRSFGLIVFVRIDLVRAAVRQNSAQFLARYKDYGLRWDPSEAVRLALWVSEQSGAMPGLTADQVTNATDGELSELMLPVWGEKMGTARSREARSRSWFLAALSDFNGGIQARDIVMFLEQSARGSIDDVRWGDRLLTPQAMREALVLCSTQKITSISEETPQIGVLLGRLRALTDERRQVPFTQESVGMASTELDLLADNGVVFREEDRYWIPEIFRHGLGFRASGRPRVLAVANLVRRRNNQD